MRMSKHGIALAVALFLQAGRSDAAGGLYERAVENLRGRLVDALGPVAAAGIPVPFEIPADLAGEVRAETRFVATSQLKCRKILHMIRGTDALAIQYDRGSTMTARDLLDARRGNCLSMANLFIGMARSVGIDAQYVHVSDIDSYHETEGSHDLSPILRSSHICAGFMEGTTLILVDATAGSIHQYKKKQLLDDLTAVALFYNNRAFEMMDQAGDASAAVIDAQIERYELAIRINPGFFLPYVNLGTAYRRRGEWQKSLDVYAKAIELNPTCAEAYSNRAAIYFSIGLCEIAIQEMAKAISHNDSNSNLFWDAGRICYSLGRYADAASYFTKAIARDRNPRYYTSLARCWIAMDMPDFAVASLEEAIATDPTHADAVRTLRALRTAK